MNIHSAILKHIKTIIKSRKDRRKFEIMSDKPNVIDTDILYNGSYLVLFYPSFLELKVKQSVWDQVLISDPKLFTKIENCIKICDNWDALYE